MIKNYQADKIEKGDSNMYIPGLTEALIYKGIAWIIAHLSASVLAHLASYVIAHGVIATVTALAPIVIYGSFVVGGVLWTGEKLEQVNKILEGIKNNDPITVASELIKIANILHTTYTGAADAVNGLLERYYGDTGEIHKVCSTIKSIAENIKK